MNELAPAFTPEMTTRLTGVSSQLLAGWFRSGVSTPRYADESGWLGVKRLYSFRDIVALRTIRSLRDDYHVSTEQLRRTNQFFQAHYEEPWTSLTLYVLSGMLFFGEPSLDVRMSTEKPWQQALLLPMSKVIRSVEEDVRKATERRPEQVGKVSRNRFIMGNEPCLDGTRIPTRLIWELDEDGYDNAAICREYPDLEPRDVAAALDYVRERRLRKTMRSA